MDKDLNVILNHIQNDFVTLISCSSSYYSLLVELLSLASKGEKEAFYQLGLLYQKGVFGKENISYVNEIMMTLDKLDYLNARQWLVHNSI